MDWRKLNNILRIHGLLGTSQPKINKKKDERGRERYCLTRYTDHEQPQIEMREKRFDSLLMLE